MLTGYIVDAGNLCWVSGSTGTATPGPPPNLIAIFVSSFHGGLGFMLDEGMTEFVRNLKFAIARTQISYPQSISSFKRLLIRGFRPFSFHEINI